MQDWFTSSSKKKKVNKFLCGFRRIVLHATVPTKEYSTCSILNRQLCLYPWTSELLAQRIWNLTLHRNELNASYTSWYWQNRKIGYNFVNLLSITSKLGRAYLVSQYFFPIPYQLFYIILIDAARICNIFPGSLSHVSKIFYALLIQKNTISELITHLSGVFKFLCSECNSSTLFRERTKSFGGIVVCDD